MQSVVVECNAKVNLYLKVKATREDGFHEIETVYHSISLSDTLTLTPSQSGLSVSCDHPMVPEDESNLAVKAAQHLLGPTTHGLHVRVEKRIPVGAGLGGGSADAAGVLAGANTLFGLGRSIDELEKVAGAVGSDVKFMLRGGCAVGKGKGEVLTFLPPLAGVQIVLVMPPIAVSTAWAYDSLKMRLTRRDAKLTMMGSALGKGNIALLCDFLENDFEGLIFERFPLVGEIKEDLLRYGAEGALMSGSGPSVYGLFVKEGDAQACRERFKNRGLDAMVVELAGCGVTSVT